MGATKWLLGALLQLLGKTQQLMETFVAAVLGSPAIAYGSTAAAAGSPATATVITAAAYGKLQHLHMRLGAPQQLQQLLRAPTYGAQQQLLGTEQQLLKAPQQITHIRLWDQTFVYLDL